MLLSSTSRWLIPRTWSCSARSCIVHFASSKSSSVCPPNAKRSWSSSSLPNKSSESGRIRLIELMAMATTRGMENPWPDNREATRAFPPPMHAIRSRSMRERFMTRFPGLLSSSKLSLGGGVWESSRPISCVLMLFIFQRTRIHIAWLSRTAVDGVGMQTMKKKSRKGDVDGFGSALSISAKALIIASVTIRGFLHRAVFPRSVSMTSIGALNGGRERILTLRSSSKPGM
mmetsp:Transcript_55624/g.75928  ORF Transcript_55624/g.75928 Transcript_55624/m.75928 type:complete len:230 (-) Transcript_55624:1189-1878(-)